MFKLFGGHPSATANPNISHAGYIPNVTKLYEVVESSSCRTVSFVKFGINTSNNKEVIYVQYGDNLFFYAFPDAIGRSLFKSDIEARVAITNKKDQSDTNKYLATNVSSAFSIANAYKQFPISHIPSNTHAEEYYYEESYHNFVQNKLKKDRIDAQLKLSSADELIEQSNSFFKQALVTDRESDAGYDPFNTNYLMANIRAKRAEAVERDVWSQVNIIHNIQKRPYIARIDCGPSKGDVHTAYIGNRDIEDLVVSWANPKIGNVYYHTDTLKKSADIYIAIKRIFSIDNSSFNGFNDEFNKYTEITRTTIPQTLSDTTSDSEEFTIGDSLLNKLLQESRMNQAVHDIIRTIQSNQYNIITAPFDHNIIVNGCAGSGKTMILYHRLSYIAYNDKSFSASNVYAITPTIWFDALNADLIKNLDIDLINNQPLKDTIQILISAYAMKNKIVYAINEESGGEHLFNGDYTSSYKLFKEQLDVIVNSSFNEDIGLWVINKLNICLSDCGILSKIPNSTDLIKKTELETFVRGYSDLYKHKIEEKYIMESTSELPRVNVENIEDLKAWLEPNKTKEENRFGKQLVWTREIMTKDKAIWLEAYRNLRSTLSGCSFSDIKASLNAKAARANSETKQAEVSQQQHFLSKVTYFLLPYLSSSETNNLKESIAKGNDFWKSPLGQEESFNFFRKLQSVNQTYDALRNYICAPSKKSETSHDSSRKIFLTLCDYIFESQINMLPHKVRELFKLRVLIDTFGSYSNEKIYYFIDEFQNYSQYELQILHDVYPKAVFNLFGDFGQQLDENGVTDVEAINDILSNDFYIINENYRNALEITKYINDKLTKKMLPIGLHGSVTEEMLPCQLELDGRTAIIYSDKYPDIKQQFLDKSSEIINDVASSHEIVSKKINLLSVAEAKGLEFETVYVVDKAMTKNEKYVAYTRALNKLILLN